MTGLLVAFALMCLGCFFGGIGVGCWLERSDRADLLREAYHAIQWMSGSSDFSPEGKAHQGWLKTRPILGKLRKAVEL